jgi:hypothetical protein
VWIFNDNGTVIKEGETITGIVKAYYDNGYLFSETYYSNGIRDGLCRQYYPDGTLMYSGYYSMGYRHGNWRSYAFAGNGQILGAYEFSGRGEEAPVNFTPQLDEKVRTAYDMMMIEDHYVNKPVIKRDIDPADANPADYGRRFGAAPPKEGSKPGNVQVRNIGAEVRHTQEIKPQNKAEVSTPKAATPAANQAAVVPQPATATAVQDGVKPGKSNNKKAGKAAKPKQVKPGMEEKQAPAKVTGGAKAQPPKKEKTGKPKAVKQPEEKKTPEENGHKHDKEK